MPLSKKKMAERKKSERMSNLNSEMSNLNPLPFDELPKKESERLSYIQSWLSDFICSDIERVWMWMRAEAPLHRGGRMERYENAYKYRLFELGW